MKIEHLVVLFIICTNAIAAPKAKPQPKKPDPIAAAQARVADAMRDPESARFSDSFVRSTGDVCGIVNGKNAMGGYAGKTRFIVTSDRVMIETESSTAAFSYRWSELCTDDLVER